MATLPAYFAQNPDVAAAYEKETYGLTPQQFADKHFELYGGPLEQRAAPAVVEAITSGNLKTLPAYFAQNEDVAENYLENTYGLTPQQFADAHYAKYGGPLEQRASPAAVTAITSGDLSSLPKYFQQNEDVAKDYLKNTYGLTPDQFAAAHYAKYGWKEQRISPTGQPAIIIKPTTTSVTPLPSPAPIGAPTVPVGQFRELFPSFAESKRLAGQMITNRPSTQSIIDMIQGGKPLAATATPINTPVVTGADNPYFIQNPDVLKSYGVNTFGLNPVDFAAAHYKQYGAGENRADPAIVAAIRSGNFSSLPTYFQQNKDVRDSYLANTFGLNPVDFSAAHFNIYGEREKRTSPSGVAPTTLNNVISTIAK